MAMIKKEQMTPGVRLRIRDRPATGLPKAIFGDTNVPQMEIAYVTMTERPGSYLNGHTAIRPGEICEVVEPPTKRAQSGNTIKVRRADGAEGYVFWSEMRASSDIVGTPQNG